MEVILTQSVPSLGLVGDVVKVKPGFARNYLFPNQLAVQATPGQLKAVQDRKKMIEVKRAHEKAEAEQYQSKLSGIALKFVRQAGEEGKIFGSVTSADIAHSLDEQGFKIDKRIVEMEKALKTLGTHQVNLRLHPQVTATLNIEIVSEA